MLHPALPERPRPRPLEARLHRLVRPVLHRAEAGSGAAVAALLDGLELFGIGYSWGGFESLAMPFDCRASRTATTWEPGGPALRFHIGLEDPADLIADLEAGFARCAAAS